MRNKAVLILCTVLICGFIGISTQTAINLKKSFSANMDMIHGHWNVTEQLYFVTRTHGQPSSVSIVGLYHESFSISFFPPTYCQAVKICFDKTRTRLATDKNILVIEERYCKKNILYSPATGKIESHGFTYNNASADFSGYTDHLTIMSPSTGDEKKYQSIMISPNIFTRSVNWKPKEVVIDHMELHHTFIFTNSRQCQAQVVIDGKMRNIDVIDRASLNDNIEMPNMFKFIAKGVDTPTFYTSTESDGKRSVDFLPILKTLKTEKDKLSVNLPLICRIAAGGIKDGIIKKKSYIRVKKVANNGQLDANRNMRKIFVDTIDCHWIRLWFTKKGTWAEYEAAIGNELAQTIDIFFHEGFVVLPDRENSIRLPGGSREIRKITIDYHGNNLGEISFGSLTDHVLNTISFKMPILDQSDYNIFMIRSPNCDANFGSDAMSSGMFGGGSKVFNEIMLTECDVRSIE